MAGGGDYQQISQIVLQKDVFLLFESGGNHGGREINVKEGETVGTLFMNPLIHPIHFCR
jgi:hypothetical protein